MKVKLAEALAWLTAIIHYGPMILSLIAMVAILIARRLHMAKELAGTDIGGDGAHVSIGVEANKLFLKATLPLEKVVEPVSKIVDDLVDKLEALIPGDQKAMAAQAKIDAKAALVKALSEEIG